MYIIAEIGFNHGGDCALAKQMIEAAAKAGADAVKFQSFKAGDLALPSSEHFSLIENGELNEAEHRELAEVAKKLDVDFLSTPFSLAAVDMLDDIGVPAFKVASMDLTNKQLLSRVAATGKPVIISSGMATLEEIAEHLDFLHAEGAGEITLLHCVSKYPAPAEELHLQAIPFLKELFGVKVGYSDHYPGVLACVAAAALGAEVIETHFTLDHSWTGGDHHHSADPEELALLVQQAKEIQAFGGSARALLTRTDRPFASDFRRGLYAARDLKAGEKLGEADFIACRPVNDFGPSDIASLTGRTLKKPLSRFDGFTEEALEQE